MERKIKLLFFFIFFSSILYSQNEVKGKIVTIKNKPLPFVTIQLVEKETGFTNSYTSSKNDGSFSLKLPNTLNNYYLKITLLGHKSKLYYLDKKNTTDVVVVLEEQTTKLKEIIITSNYKEFEVKKDSISYNLSKVKDGTETNLKDLVEKLPGLTIDDNNKVNFQGKVIDKVVIENEDFFGKKHEMATENLPAEAVQGIQLLKSFKEFDDIGDKKSGKIVLNITLNKNYKNKIVGNFEGNSGVDKKHQIHTNLFKFFKRGNFALVTEANNIGESAVNMLDYIEMQGGIGNFTSNYNEGGSGVYEIDHAKIPRYVFVNKNVDGRNTIFNSLNFSNKLSNKTKINGYLTLDYTKINELKNSTKKIITKNSSVVEENQTSAGKSYLGNSFVNVVYKKNDNEVFKYNLKVNPLSNNEDLKIVGDINLINNIEDNDFLIGQSFVYKNQLSSKVYLETILGYDYKTQERDFNISSNSAFLGLNFSNDFTLQQKTNVKQNSVNIGSRLQYKFSEKTKLTTSFFYNNNDERLYNRADNQFNFITDKEQKTFSVYNNISNKITPNFSVNGSLNYVCNSLKVNLENKKYNWLMPSLSLIFEFENQNTIGVSYNKSIKNISIFQMNNKDRIINYQTKINKNIDVFTPTDKVFLSFYYSGYDAINNSMLSFSGSYFEIKNEIGFNSIFSNNFIEQNYVRVPQKGFDLGFYYSKTIKVFPIKWDVKIFYKKIHSLSFLEENENRNKNTNYGLDLRLSTKFKKFPFQGKLNLYYSDTKTTNDFSVLDYSLKQINIHPKIYGKINSVIWNLGCFYQSVKSTNTSQNIYAVNFSTQWNFNKEIQLFFRGTNILNLKNNQFISQQNTESFSQFTTFERLEGNVLVGLRYHF